MRSGSESMVSLILTATMLSVFVGIPFGLPAIGLSQVVSLAIAILAVGILADSFMTRYGLRVGGREANPFYHATKRLFTPDEYVVAIALIKLGVGLVLLVVLPNPYLLLLIALYSLSGVLFNSIGLAVSRPVAVDSPTYRREEP